jgi:hypothetical protein
MIFRILLNPFATGGGAASAAPAPAPSAPSPEPQGPPAGSPERMPVSPASSQGPRDFDFHERGESNPAAPAQTQGQVQSGPQGGNIAPARPAAPAPTDPNLAPNTQGTGTPAPAQWQSIREAAGNLGFRFPGQVQDDGQALQYLIHQLQAQNHYAQLGQRFAASQVDQFGRPQAQAPAAPAAPQRKAWEAPEFNQKWLSLVEFDQSTGMYLSKPGAPPWVGEKVQAYSEWKERYDANPAAVMNEAIREAAREEAQTLYRTEFQQQQTRSQAAKIVSDNAPWFYAKDQAGQRARDWQGNPVPTPAGLRYLHHLQALQQAGVTNPVQQDQWAKQAVMNEWYGQQAQAQQQQSQANGPASTFAQNQPNTNPLSGLSPQSRAAQPHNVEPEGTDDLAELKAAMRKGIKQAGITDDDFMRQHVFSE